MKKICHVTSVHGRYDVRIFQKQCKSLVQAGYDVTLIVNDGSEDECIDHINIKSTNFMPKNRLNRIVATKRIIRKLMAETDADIYQFHDAELLPEAKWIKKRNKKVIFDFHEDMSTYISYKEWIPKFFRKTVAFAYSKYEYSVIHKLDALISVTPIIVDRLKKSNENTVMLTNFPRYNPIKREISDDNNICFAGGIKPQWNHKAIIEAIDNVKNVKYQLAGKVSDKYLQELQKLKGWKNVEYHGIVTHDEVNKLYAKSMAGIALLTYDSQVGKQGTLGNTKLFEVMNVGLPVICSNNRIWQEIVEEHQCGILVEPGCVSDIENAIKYLLDNPDTAQLMGQNGQKAIKDTYNWENEEKKLVQLYEDVFAK